MKSAGRWTPTRSLSPSLLATWTPHPAPSPRPSPLQGGGGEAGIWAQSEWVGGSEHSAAFGDLSDGRTQHRRLLAVPLSTAGQRRSRVADQPLSSGPRQGSSCGGPWLVLLQHPRSPGRSRHGPHTGHCPRALALRPGSASIGAWAPAHHAVCSPSLRPMAGFARGRARGCQVILGSSGLPGARHGPFVASSSR